MISDSCSAEIALSSAAEVLAEEAVEADALLALAAAALPDVAVLADVDALLAVLADVEALLAVLEDADALLAEADALLALAEAALPDADALLADDDPPPQAAKPSMATSAALAINANTFVFVCLIVVSFHRRLPTSAFLLILKVWSNTMRDSTTELERGDSKLVLDKSECINITC